MGRTTMMVLVAATLTGCYAPGPTVTSPTGPVTRQELRGAGEPMLGPALGALRPAWVRGGRYRTPGAPRGEAPVVYIDGQPPQEMGVLQSIPVADVERVIYLGPRDATTRYGIGHAGGAIIVQTRIGAGAAAWGCRGSRARSSSSSPPAVPPPTTTSAVCPAPVLG